MLIVLQMGIESVSLLYEAIVHRGIQ